MLQRLFMQSNLSEFLLTSFPIGIGRECERERGREGERTAIFNEACAKLFEPAFALSLSVLLPNFKAYFLGLAIN